MSDRLEGIEPVPVYKQTSTYTNLDSSEMNKTCCQHLQSLFGPISYIYIYNKCIATSNYGAKEGAKNSLNSVSIL